MNIKIKTVLAIIVVILVIATAYSIYLNLKERGYSPFLLFEMDKSIIETNNNQKSNDIVTLRITKQDNNNIPTNFTLKFIPSNPDYAYPVSVYANEKLENITTRTLIDKGASDMIQFKVFGKLMSGQPYSPYTIKIELYYNNSKIEERILTVKVNE